MPEQNISQDARVTKMLEQMLSDAIEKNASDIHMDPGRNHVSVRFRIDGVLYEVSKLPRDLYKPIASTMKVMSKLDITEHRTPQDGSFEVSNKMSTYNFRISTFPSVYGESIVLRILNKDSVIFDLREFGFDPEQFNLINKLIKSPFGIILVTGPSGSGKTSLMYSVLNVLNKQSVNIITIEDPVEFLMDGTRQSQVSSDSEYTFARAMKSILRQDPDVVMLGEIRDTESAQIAAQVSLTGRLVFSTIHTLNIRAAVARLLEMQVPPSVVANALTGIVASRLVRKICPSCKQPYYPTDLEKTYLGNLVAADQIYFKGMGCDKCMNSGYLGRTGIFEIVEIDDELKKLIMTDSSLPNLQEILKAKGVRSLGSSALAKVLAGETTVEEAIRVVGSFN